MDEDIPTTKRLLPTSICYNEDNTWGIACEGGAKLCFKALPSTMQKLLRRCRAKDSLTAPNSLKGMTYKEMVDNIIQGKMQTIYLWKSKAPKSMQDIDGLLRD